MGVVTTIHQLHAHVLVPQGGGPGLHVVWIGAIPPPAAWIPFTLAMRRGSRAASAVDGTIIVAGLAGLGLYEGLWNHAAKIVAHRRRDVPGAEASAVLPPDGPHLRLHEVTGVPTIVVAMLAGRCALRFASGRRARRTRPRQGSRPSGGVDGRRPRSIHRALTPPASPP